MTINKKSIRKKILANLASYGVQWSETDGKISVTNFRETQAKLANQTNPKSEIYFEKAKKYDWLTSPNESPFPPNGRIRCKCKPLIKFAS